MTDKFVIESISVYNYLADNNSINGTVKIKNNGTKTSIEMPLTSEDAADIIAVFASRIALHMGVVAAAVIEELKPQPVIAAPAYTEVETTLGEEFDRMEEEKHRETRQQEDDDYPF